MEEYLISMAVSIILTTIKATVKNAESKEKLKKIFLKIYTAVGALYADDPDFQKSEN